MLCTPLVRFARDNGKRYIIRIGCTTWFGPFFCLKNAFIWIIKLMNTLLKVLPTFLTSYEFHHGRNAHLLKPRSIFELKRCALIETNGSLKGQYLGYKAGKPRLLIYFFSKWFLTSCHDETFGSVSVLASHCGSHPSDLTKHKRSLSRPFSAKFIRFCRFTINYH